MKQVPQISADVIQNTLQGIAIGDAYGAGVEFQDRAWICENVDFTRFVDARASIQVAPDQRAAFIQDYHPWDYTDDTEMTVALIRALMDAEPFSEDLLVAHLHAEYERGKQAKGYGRNGHGSLRWLFEGKMSITEVRDFQRDRPNPGNAPAVRAVPIGLLPAHMIEAYATVNANATHPNPQAAIASQCIARASECILAKGISPTNVIQYCIESIALNPDYKNYLQAVDQLPQYEALREIDFEILCGPQPIQAPYFLPGICGVPSDSKYTVGTALYILKHNATPFDALQKSIQIGGDVDSIAAITVGILAGQQGLASIPTFMQQNTEGLPYLKTIAQKFAKHLEKTSAPTI